MDLPENTNAGRRAIVIEDLPAGTGIADLVRAFSPFGAIQFASMGPPAVVGFENERSAVHALLVSSMKSVSLLGAFNEKKAAASAESPVTEAAATASPAAPETKITQIDTVAAAAPPTEAAAASETKTSPNKDATAILDQETLDSIHDSIAALEENNFVIQATGNAVAALERHVRTMKKLLVEQRSDEYLGLEEEGEEVVNDDLDHDRAWSDGYHLAFWGNANHYEAWLAGYQAGEKDSRWKEGDAPIYGNRMLAK